MASVVVTGSPFDIWSGPVDMAFGAEWRSDEAQFEADDLLFTGDAIGLNAEAPIDGTESVIELYSEAIFTLLQGHPGIQKLEMELGGRWSSYDNAGTVETWKAGLNWQLNDSIRFRAMMQHAVRAPNNAELFTAQFSQFGSFVGTFSVDPCSASQDPVGSGNAEKCTTQGLPSSQLGVFEATPFYPVEYVNGGNLDLEPESSDTFTIGAVLTPRSIPGLTLAIDYYDLEVTDTIGGVDSDTVCFDPLNIDGVFCDEVQRDNTGNISRVKSLVQNRGVLATDGIDFQAQYQMDLPGSLALIGDEASLTMGAALTHILSLNFQENVVTQVFDCVGLFGWPCNFVFVGGLGSFPENRLNSHVNYRSGSFTANLNWRWIDGMDNAAPLGSGICCGIDDPVTAVPSISSWNYFDLGLAYEWDNGLLLRLGVNNLTDKQPPLMGDAQFSNNTDTLMYDIFGRSYYFNLRYQFGL